MKLNKTVVLAAMMMASFSLSLSAADAKKDMQMTKSAVSKSDDKEIGLYANFDTSMGAFVVKLFPEDAPKTVENFVSLAQGAKEFTDPKTGQKVKRPLYDGLIFHRVIPNFMVQGGDPLGTGTGGPGYRFDDEFQSGRHFDKVGILAMANAGPGTNGSQFFITTALTPWLDNHHTIFGEVIEGYPVVEAISNVKRDGNDRPLTPVTLKSVRIEKVSK